MFFRPYLRTLILGGLPLLAALACSAAAQTGTERVSVSPTEEQGDRGSYGPVQVSADGRFVVFTSDANNFSGHDTLLANGTIPVWLHRDLMLGEHNGDMLE